ncbi:MAG: DUF5717 family protein [Defluviitaleaceae bacterium]|nr:DUF5717 family protein [Defluviitaleaceae bacterium]
MTPPPYQHPHPTLELDINTISIETGHHTGSFVIKNTGGGTLTGHILSRNHAITFTPNTWTGNSQAITYNFNPEKAGTSPGFTKTKAYITSTGGEVILPITISATTMTIPTPEGPTIACISDFYNYAQEYPNAARRLFTSSEFYMLLLSTNYTYMEVYENLHKDVNRERAMDNFFILSGLKAKTTIELSTNQINITQGPPGKIHESFSIQKSDSGYIDAPITTLLGSNWLTLSTDRLSSPDFDSSNRAMVEFTVDPLKIPQNFVREHIQVGTAQPAGDTAGLLEVTFRRAPNFTINLNQKGFRYEDKGSVVIKNNTGANMRVDVFSRDRYVRFYAQAHMVGPVHSIPFEIRPSAFAGAQRLFRRLPYVSTYIDVRVHSMGQVFHKRLHLNIGEW